MSTTVTSHQDASGSHNIPHPTILRCRICRQPYDGRKAVCPRCGTPLSQARQTVQLMPAVPDGDPALQPHGAAFTTPQNPIVLQVNERQVVLPAIDEIVIGRYSIDDDDARPDIDLGPLGGEAAGVSRRHVLITNRNNLLYVTDLGSRNGTWVNRHRVFAHTARPLRSGDELRLGRLKIIIQF